jgi:hypothetical protein
MTDSHHAELPAVTSGYGAIMEQEQVLLSSTRGFREVSRGPHSTSIDRMLNDQLPEIRRTIELLEQRYLALPIPTRFEALHDGLAPLLQHHRRAAATDGSRVLLKLVEQHRRVIENIDTLILKGAARHYSEVILADVAYQHEEMMGKLIELIKKHVGVHDETSPPVIGGIKATPGTTEAGWENEGGAPRGPVAPGAGPSTKSSA